MLPQDLNTKEENTWCPGCPNFGILQSFKEAISELVNESKIKLQNTAMVTGIGCHAKLYDYLNLSAFYGLHGRVLPVALGMKVANPDLTVVGFGGDGDTFAEGMDHFVHSCRYNPDLTMIVHNNQVFALTVGQSTPTSEKVYAGGFSPFGVHEQPLNPIALALVNGASFIARAYALQGEHMRQILKQAILHKGFSFVEILQPCITFHNVIPYFQKNVYKLENAYDVSDFDHAFKRAQEWDYCFDRDQKVPIGVFYKKERPIFEEQWPQYKSAWHTVERKINWQELIKEFK